VIFDEPSRQPLPQPTFEDVKYAARTGLISMVVSFRQGCVIGLGQ